MTFEASGFPGELRVGGAPRPPARTVLLVLVPSAVSVGTREGRAGLPETAVGRWAWPSALRAAGERGARAGGPVWPRPERPSGCCCPGLHGSPRCPAPAPRSCPGGGHPQRTQVHLPPAQAPWAPSPLTALSPETSWTRAHPIQQLSVLYVTLGPVLGPSWDECWL